jgi:hypothetical protein
MEEPAIVIAVAAQKAFIIDISDVVIQVANDFPWLQSKDRSRTFE